MSLRILNGLAGNTGKGSCKTELKANGISTDSRNAAVGTELHFSLKVKRSLATVNAYLLFAHDGEEPQYYEGDFETLECGMDSYTFPSITENNAGLYFFGFELHTSTGKWYVYGDGSLGFEMKYTDQMLLWDEQFESPEWLDGGIIYQIFVDRFCKGSKTVPCRADAVLYTDWDNGVPEFAAKPGDYLRNNTFFGGTLWGVAEKLDYLKSLNVKCIYLCPIFKAYSNHKYDTVDYMTVDEMFGGEEALVNLLKKAKQKGIGVILDGVFNHVGDHSIYFDRFGEYGNGACQSKNSPYYDWFSFIDYPHTYESWWGIDTLPRVRREAAFTSFVCDEGGVVDKYMKLGVNGFRFDVVDELECDFVDKLCAAVKRGKSDAYVVGEVWEDASDKVAYDERKRYFQGKQLDAVMNYPLRNALIDYAMNGNSKHLAYTVEALNKRYPKHKTKYMMNFLGTHDTERILTVLGGDEGHKYSNTELSTKRMNAERKRTAVNRLKIASLLQMTLPGVPCVYYGDEVGMEGYHDPFNRCPFPWGREDTELLDWFKSIAALRKTEKVLNGSELKITHAEGGLFGFEREGKILVLTNNGDESVTVTLDKAYKSIVGETVMADTVKIPAQGFAVLKKI